MMIKEFRCRLSIDPNQDDLPKRVLVNGFRALIRYTGDSSGRLHGCVFHPKKGFIESGETQECKVIPLFPIFHSAQAAPNQEFLVLEGNRPIGKGVIVSVELM